MRFAAIDLGTNTVRLLIGEVDDTGVQQVLYADQEVTRLGEGLRPEGLLRPDPIRRTLATLRRFREAAVAHGASQVAVVGTSALREARNREVFLAQAAEQAGVAVRVISGREEALLTLLGVRAALPFLAARPFLLMDIGGGSTEFLLAQGEAIRATVSTGLGVVKLTEAHIRCDPPSPQELTAIREAATARLRILRERDLPSLGHGEIFVGTAGTVTSLAAMDLELDPYDPDRVNGHHLSRDQVAELSDRLARLPLRLRRATPGLEAARADVIVAGTVVCQAAMEILGYREIVVSDGGLREGILLDLIRQRAAEGQGSTNAKDVNLSELRSGGPAKLDKPGVIC